MVIHVLGSFPKKCPSFQQVDTCDGRILTSHIRMSLIKKIQNRVVDLEQAEKLKQKGYVKHSLY